MILMSFLSFPFIDLLLLKSIIRSLTCGTRIVWHTRTKRKKKHNSPELPRDALPSLHGITRTSPPLSLHRALNPPHALHRPLRFIRTHPTDALPALRAPPLRPRSIHPRIPPRIRVLPPRNRRDGAPPAIVHPVAGYRAGIARRGGGRGSGSVQGAWGAP